MRRLTLIDGSGASRAAGVDEDGAPRAAGKEGSMRIAIATQDMKLADSHFASARTLAFYDISGEGHRFVEAVQFSDCSNADGVHDDSLDRIAVRLEALKGCALLFVTGIGGPAAARVVNQRVHPVKLQTPEPIPDLLDRLRRSLEGTPPPWMRKLLQAERADFTAED